MGHDGKRQLLLAIHLLSCVCYKTKCNVTVTFSPTQEGHTWVLSGQLSVQSILPLPRPPYPGPRTPLHREYEIAVTGLSSDAVSHVHIYTLIMPSAKPGERNDRAERVGW